MNQKLLIHFFTFLSNYLHRHEKMSKLFHTDVLCPQCSGIMFLIVPYLARKIRPKQIVEHGNTDALHYTSMGLCVSSLVFWNYVMHSTQRTFQYNFACALDYTMISTTVAVSTFPKILNSIERANNVLCVFMLDTIRYYSMYGKMDSYKTHHLMCYLSTFMGLYRSGISFQWAPTFLRIYSTIVCTLIFQLSITRRTNLKSYRQISWYIPWLWHMHASICQQTSIELSYHAEKRLTTTSTNMDEYI